jgi:hypothetical protein
MFSIAAGKLSNSPRQIPTIGALCSLSAAAAIPAVEKVIARQKSRLVEGVINSRIVLPLKYSRSNDFRNQMSE